MPKTRNHEILTLLGIVLLAYGLCLGAGYYMDDHYFVVDTDGFSPARWHITFGNWVVLDGGPKPTYACNLVGLLPALLITWHQKLFGTDAWSIHVWNLFLHAATVLVSRVTFLRFLTVFQVKQEDAPKLAFWGAAIFSCHPLASEPVNYAKCVYMQLVGLTTMVFCYQLLTFLAFGKRRTLLWVGIWAVAAHLSYHYGLPSVAVAAVAILVPFYGRRMLSWVKMLFRGPRWRLFMAVGILLGGVLFVADVWGYNLMVLLTSKQYPMLNHWFTQSRVLWAYLWRMVLPVRLCSDHYVTWTTSAGDLGAWLSVIGILGLLGTLAWAVWKKPVYRPWGVAGLLLLAPLLQRLLYSSAEVMVEYRTYGSLPWASLLLAGGLLAVSRLGKLAMRLPHAVVLIFCVLAAQRSLLWSSKEALCRNVLAQYPLNNRPRAELFLNYIETKDLPAIRQLHADCVQAHEALLQGNREHPVRQYHDWRSEKNYFTCDLMYLDALAILKAPEYAPGLWDELDARWTARYPTYTQPLGSNGYWRPTFLKLRQKHLR